MRKDLDQVKQELTDKIDKIALQVSENREQMAVKDEVDKRFDAVDKRFDAVDKRFDVVNERFDELLRGQDEMIGILTRVDDERVATTAWVRRVEGDLSASEGQAGVETNTGEIKKIKTKLAMDI